MNALNRKALTAGTAGALAVVTAIWLGSRALTHFDPALIWYATGSVLAAFALAYRFAVWAQRPPTRLYFKRGLQLLFQRYLTAVSRTADRVSRFNAQTLKRSNVRSPALTMAHAIATDFAAQNFIRRRGVYRWIMHVCLSGGCSLAFAITFPLVFGWVHFEPGADNAEVYRVNLVGFNAGAFSVHSVQAWVMFNLLNLSAVLVMIGLVMAGIRRLVSAGERAVQTFAEDILPLLLIFAVTASGLMLTVSYKLLAGRGHSQVATFHAASVIALLFYIPFGKLFHMFQRTCALCVSLYKAAGATGPRAHCLGAARLRVSDARERFETRARSTQLQTTSPPRRRNALSDICPPAAAGPGVLKGAFTGRGG
jgi:hypothetical protein